MEGTPFAVENSNEDDEKEEKRKSRAKQPEHFGILAVESPSEEPKLSPLERAIAAIRQPAPEAEKKPDAEEEPVVLPETEPPVERAPEEDARRIVHEMVSVEQPAAIEQEETPEPATEAEPEPEVEPTPEPEAEAAPAEIPEVEPTPPAEAEPEEAPAVQVMPETVPEPVTEAEPEPEVETEPEPPVEAPAKKPETPSDEDDKKPGFFSSLFRRRGRNKTEEEPEEPAPVVEKDEPDGPEFHFTEKTEDSAERPEAAEAPEEPETSPEPEANPERIGQMLLHVEDVAVERPSQVMPEAAVSSQAAEERMNVESSPIEPASGKRIDTLSRAELMQLGETIEINGSNLRHIYETHLIGERGLRRLVAEYVRGGDLPRALRREVLAHEMDFERDPVMRDLAPPAAAPVTSNHTALEKLLKEADVSMSSHGEQTAFSQASTKYETAGARQRQSRQYRVLDIALIATISFLTLLVILVLLARG